MKALVINCSPVRTGATAEIVKTVCTELSSRYDTKSICIDDYKFAFCKGCRSCHATAKCVMPDASVICDIMNDCSSGMNLPELFLCFVEINCSGACLYVIIHS